MRNLVLSEIYDRPTNLAREEGEGAHTRAMCTGPKVLVTLRQPRSSSVPRDVSGDHVLNKRESRPERSHSRIVPLSRIVWSVARGSRTVFLARSGAACPCISRRACAAESARHQWRRRDAEKKEEEEEEEEEEKEKRPYEVERGG